jgi:hypothetical protein
MRRRSAVRNPTTARRVCVDGIGLATLARGEYPHPGRELRRHIHDRFPVSDQALGDVAADAVAALDGPGSVWMPAAEGEHLLVSVAVGAKPAPIHDPFAVIDDLDCR